MTKSFNVLIIVIAVNESHLLIRISFLKRDQMCVYNMMMETSNDWYTFEMKKMHYTLFVYTFFTALVLEYT